MITTHQVHFGEDAFARQVCREVLNVGDWVAVGYSCVIEVPVVTARSPPHGGGHGGSVHSTVASQQEGCGFKSRMVQHVGACSRAFLCGVCMFSPCSPGFPP